MSMKQQRFKSWAPTAVMLTLTLASLAPLTPVTAQTPAVRSRGSVTVNFVNADIEAVTRAFAAIVERPIVVDPRVKGTITVYSEQPQSVRDAFQSYQSALRGLGFSVVESGGLLKVVPEAEAKLQTGTVSVGAVGTRGDQVITQIFNLRFENPNNLVAILRPLISANNTINANPGNNSLVITDYADNLQRIAKIIAALDQSSGTDVEIVPLEHAVAADMAPLVQRMSDGGGALVPGAQPGGGGTTILADSRSNSLIVRAPNAARLAALKSTIARLDRPNNLTGPGGGLWVVHLKNADAARLATVVRAAFGALGSNAAGGAGGGVSSSPSAPSPSPPGGQVSGNTPGGGGLATAAQPSTGGFIQADPATNSLVITAPEPLYRQVRALIDQLDTRRAQVYIESMIVEVSPNESGEYGFQWAGLLGKSGDKTGLIAGTILPGSGPSIIDINASAAAGAVNLGAGLNIGLLKAINGVTALPAILRLLQTQAETNVVSTPNLITLDNEEAKIVVGENVPFVTGQFSNTGAGGGGATVNPFQTIERKDVGITLRIRPQIGEGGAVRMTIFQEQSSVKEGVAAGTTNAGPSTTKRSIENTVVVDDGAILVLGGLIEDRFELTRSKVPLLGDLPFVGGLFRSETRTRKRSNLMVFLRPVVVRDADSATRLSLDRYDQIRGEQKAAQPEQSYVLPINDSPVLPPLREPRAPAVPALSPAPAPAP
jgi:general secretion pathway protein D